jgi:hypothetical protein
VRWRGRSRADPRALGVSRSPAVAGRFPGHSRYRAEQDHLRGSVVPIVFGTTPVTPSTTPAPPAGGARACGADRRWPKRTASRSRSLVAGKRRDDLRRQAQQLLVLAAVVHASHAFRARKPPIHGRISYWIGQRQVPIFQDDIVAWSVARLR